MKKTETSFAAKIWLSFLIITALLVISSIIAVLFGGDTEAVGANTALIRVNGPIMSDSTASLFAESVASSTDIIEQLERARDDDSITSVILEINSPGGSAVASDEIAMAVKDLRANNKTVVAWIRESGASGAYWIASSSDHIVANRMSITGSIGVISSYMEFDEFLEEWNVSYNRLVAGERKDIGDPFTQLSGTEREFLQRKLDRVHGFFIDEVARNRNMDRATVAKLSDGQFFLGVEAYEVGLIDELGGKETVVAYLQNKTGDKVTIVEYEPEGSFFDALFGTAAREPNIADFMRLPRAQDDVSPLMLR